MFDSTGFKAMEGKLSGLWIKQQVHQNNIANYETPNFKANEISFKETLKKEKDSDKSKTIFTANISKNNSLSSRVDGNNVDMEKESLELYKSFVEYSYITQKISGSFKNMRYVINQSGR
ncbi:MAG: flagellar basal body rod protein FlgB [Oscillospiraceae bacterium]